MCIMASMVIYNLSIIIKNYSDGVMAASQSPKLMV